ncbi:hypothetical protein FIBSPDRAFT_735305 [Athelia psychrophila]|uniref:Golgi apparatus membrane protein TVP38 n=1 Tax=Athelia psychrophila TaxID=1759441 RepID=A0A166N540_9AGAM|nr:hypothetical protein FIBSPDRAFT_735305 [Fibularhizoctonia sp. CBS 109695]
MPLEELQLHTAQPTAPTSHLAGTSRTSAPNHGHPNHLRQPSFQHYPSSLLAPQSSSRNASSQPYTRPRGLRISNLIKPWIPVIVYGITTVGFLVAIAFWKKEVFQGLDDLSLWLRVDEQFGYAVLFGLIFLTTFPPIPLYSTLIILSGYTFGPWTGAIISYFAALSGALTVFIISRTFLRETISAWLSCTTKIKRVVRAIEKRPKLLFLIRLAPYPYNVMNCLLAASPHLTLRTYTICTAVSLFKVIVHTMLGASMHSFSTHKPELASDDTGSNTVSQLWTAFGIALCIAIFIYLSYVARRAVDDELEEDTLGAEEERVSFLSAEGDEMTESPFSLGAASRGDEEARIGF